MDISPRITCRLSFAKVQCWYLMRCILLAFLLTFFSSLQAQTSTPAASSQSDTESNDKTDVEESPGADAAVMDTAQLNALKDTVRWRLMQFFDIDMLEKCLEVKSISNLSGLSLLTKNQALGDTVSLFEKKYETTLYINSFINSSQLWPRLLFSPGKTTAYIGEDKNKPAVGFDIRFTPQGTGDARVFHADILNKATQGLLDSTRERTLLQATNQDLINRQFTEIKTSGKDTANVAMFRGIASLRDMFNAKNSKNNLSQVTFEPCTGQQFGFDMLPNVAVKSYYETMTVEGHNYEVPWKSVSTDGSDSVKVTLALSDKNAANHQVNFRSLNPPMEIHPTGKGMNMIALNGGANKSEQVIEAFYVDTMLNGNVKDHVIGKLKIRSYAPVTRKLTPVILNGASFSLTAADLEKALNGIYRQAAVVWTVTAPLNITVGKDVWDKDGDGTLLIETSPFSRYSGEMQAIIDGIGSTTDPETYYVVITDVPNTYGYAGYMPLKSQYAFLFTGNFSAVTEGSGGTTGENSGYHIIAHELGHGTFCMKHIEDEYKILDATDNLMNGYTMGRALWKPQWDWIGDPSWRLYMFQSEGQGAMGIQGNPIQLRWTDFQYKPIDPTTDITFLSPSGLPFTIIGILSQCLVASEEGSYIYKNQEGSILVDYQNEPDKLPLVLTNTKPGAVFGFVLNGEKWIALFGETSDFLGYYNATQKKYLFDTKQYREVYRIWYWKGNQDENKQWDRLDACLNPSVCAQYNQFNKDGYKASAPYNTDPLTSIKASCSVPPAYNTIKSVTWAQLLNTDNEAIYRDGYMLYRYNFKGDYVMLGCRYDELQHKNYYYIYNSVNWEPFTPPKFSDAAFTNIWLTCKYTGHTSLDLFGSVPLFGEAFDALNGVWYWAEGDGLNASMSFACAFLPVVGDATIKGAKYTVKIYKGLKSVPEVFELTHEAYQSLNSVQKTLKIADKLQFDEIVKNLTKLYADFPLLVADIERLAKAFDNPQKLKTVLSKIETLVDTRAAFMADIKFVEGLPANSLANNLGKIDEGMVEAWEVFHKSGVGDAVRKNITKLDELKGLIKNNNLGWQKADFENLLTRPADKPWDNADEVITGLKRTSDANIDGLTLSYKKFPQPKDGSYSYVLDQAKKYQGGLGYDNAGNIVKGSGDANLSFDYNGVSFDNLTADGTLIDRKFGQGNSIFDKVVNDFDEFDIVVKNDSRINSLLDQAKRQINAAGGKPIRWEISTELGVDGIKQVFSNTAYTSRFPGVDFSKIDVVWVKM